PTYVYPDEHLPTPPGERLTYRRVDALTILTLIHRAGPPPRALEAMAARAETTLLPAEPLWRGRGFNKTRRHRGDDGSALDAFCGVGWLARDPDMAGEPATARGEDSWLPPGWYSAAEGFRADADESWCLRLLHQTIGIDGAAARVRDRIAASLK